MVQTILTRGEEEQSCQGNRGLVYTHPPPRPGIGPIPLCVSLVLNFTDPPGLGRTASLIRTNGRETRQLKRYFIRVKDVVMKGKTQSTGMTNTGIHCF